MRTRSRDGRGNPHAVWGAREGLEGGHSAAPTSTIASSPVSPPPHRRNRPTRVQVPHLQLHLRVRNLHYQRGLVCPGQQRLPPPRFLPQAVAPSSGAATRRPSRTRQTRRS